MIYNKENFIIVSLAGDLHGLHLTNRYTETTNGHYAVRVSVPEFDEKDLPLTKTKSGRPTKRKRIDVVLDKKSAEHIAKQIPSASKYGQPLILNTTWVGNETNKEQTQFVTSNLDVEKSVFVRNEERKFPKVDKITPRRTPKMRIAVSPAYMKSLMDSLVKMKANKASLSLYGEDSVIKIEAVAESGQEVMMLLMPMKIDKHEKKEPVTEKEKKEEPVENVAEAEASQG